MTADRDSGVWLHPDDTRCVGRQCDRKATCARARSPIPRQYARIADFGLDVQVWRPCAHWLDAAQARPPTAVTVSRRHKAIT